MKERSCIGRLYTGGLVITKGLVLERRPEPLHIERSPESKYLNEETSKRGKGRKKPYLTILVTTKGGLYYLR
ncbi:hypothetical protein RB195_003010 [Necator americanus]|uniref:Uncharacterized protein n=1 Tax=Necator americanus TaxID=51031 RepID=A0ABR1DLN0_NECAM